MWTHLDFELKHSGSFSTDYTQKSPQTPVAWGPSHRRYMLPVAKPDLWRFSGTYLKPQNPYTVDAAKTATWSTPQATYTYTVGVVFLRF